MLTSTITFLSLVLKDVLGILPKKGTPHQHLAAAQAWLKLAHDVGADDGVSYGYSVRGGWLASYRETSGYIATTFFQLADVEQNSEYFERAIHICKWLISVQNNDGSFANPRYGDSGIVFDTGQVLFGLVQAYEKTHELIFFEAASRAANWLIRVADKSGVWTRCEHLNTPHVYNTRTSWALLRMNQVEYTYEREAIARANLDWALSQQQSNGFFDNCSFKKGVPPYTHTIAYTTRGLLESGLLLNDERYLSAATRCANATLSHLRIDGFLPGQVTIDGKSAAQYCCLTGNCQFSIIWAKLFDQTQNETYRNAVNKALDYVMSNQDIHTNNPFIRGATKGSQPIWGHYSPLCFPNWPTKFFIDAMLLKNWLGL